MKVELPREMNSRGALIATQCCNFARILNILNRKNWIVKLEIQHL